MKLFLLLLLPMLVFSWDETNPDGTLKDPLRWRKLLNDPQLRKEMLSTMNFEKMVNAVHQKYQKQAKFLVYDENLTRIAEIAGRSCPKFVKHGSNYRQYNTIQDVWRAEALKAKSLGEGDYLGQMELYNPVQDKIGCAVSSCDTLICNVGPFGSWKYEDWAKKTE